MFTKPFVSHLGLGLLLSLFALAPAEGQTYSVLSTSSTSGFPGVYRDSVAKTGTSAATLSNPPGYTFTSTAGPYLYAEAYADSAVITGSLEGKVDATATRLSGNSFPNNGPISFSESRFVDSVLVESGTLPLNTPVTLIFHNRIDVSDWHGTGQYDGYLSTELQVASSVSNVRWELNNNNGVQPVPAQQVVIQTKVGARLYLKDRLQLLARGFYYMPGPLYSGAMGITATVDLEVETSDDVTLRGDSGTLYTIVQ